MATVPDSTLNTSINPSKSTSPDVINTFQQPQKAPHHYLFAPPYYQPRFSTSDFRKYKNISTLTPHDLQVLQDDEISQPLSRPCCFDYLNYTNLRLGVAIRHTMGAIVCLTLNFVFLNKYPSFYLGFPIVLMATSFTVGGSMPLIYGMSIAMLMGLFFNWIIFKVFTVTALVVGLGIPIGLLIGAIMWTSKVSPYQWKMFATFYPVFLLIVWNHNGNTTNVIKLMEMCLICFGLSIGLVLLPYPLMSNHYVDHLVRKVIRDSSKVSYLITRGFLNERFSKTHLNDYAYNTDDELKKRQQFQVNDGNNSKRTNTLHGSLFESHFKGIKVYNLLQDEKKKQKRLKRDMKLQSKQQQQKQQQSILNINQSSLPSNSTPTISFPIPIPITTPQSTSIPTQHLNSHLTNTNSKLPHRQFSHQLYYNMHLQGGREIFVESYSDDLSSCTDDDMCLFIHDSDISQQSILTTDDEDDIISDCYDGIEHHDIFPSTQQEQFPNDPNQPFINEMSLLSLDNDNTNYYNSTFLPQAPPQPLPSQHQQKSQLNQTISTPSTTPQTTMTPTTPIKSSGNKRLWLKSKFSPSKTIEQNENVDDELVNYLNEYSIDDGFSIVDVEAIDERQASPLIIQQQQQQQSTTNSHTNNNNFIPATPQSNTKNTDSSIQSLNLHTPTNITSTSTRNSPSSYSPLALEPTQLSSTSASHSTSSDDNDNHIQSHKHHLDEEIHDTPYFDDLYAHFNRKYAPEHPQGSIHVFPQDQQHVYDQIHEVDPHLNEQQHQQKQKHQKPLVQENPHFLHVPFPQLYFNNLRDVLADMERDLDSLRDYIIPLKYEGIIFRIITFLLCCCCCRYKPWDRPQKSTTTFSGGLNGPTNATTASAELDIQLQNNNSNNIFYPQPSWFYPNIFTAHSFFAPPYNTESLQVFISEMLFAINNVKGMITNLERLPNLSKGGLILYHFWASFIRHDMKRLVWIYKSYVNNIINHNEDLYAMDSAFISAMFNISAQNKNNVNPQQQQKHKSNRPTTTTTTPNSKSPATSNHRDVFTSLYITLSKFKFSNPKPNEKDVRHLQFVIGTFASVLHQFRNFWLQSSRIRQAAFYGIRKTKFVKIKQNENQNIANLSSTTTFDRNISTSNQPSSIQSTTIPSSQHSSQTTTTGIKYQLKTRRIADPIFNFHTTISERFAPRKDVFSAPIYNNLYHPYQEHTETILQSPFSELYAPQIESESTNKQSQSTFNYQQPTILNPTISTIHNPTTSIRHSSSTPHGVKSKSKTKSHSTSLPSSIDLNSKELKQHFKITLEDVVLFNNFFFNFDRYHTRLLTSVIPSITPHLYPLALITTTVPSNLTIPHNSNTIAAMLNATSPSNRTKPVSNTIAVNSDVLNENNNNNNDNDNNNPTPIIPNNNDLLLDTPIPPSLKTQPTLFIRPGQPLPPIQPQATIQSQVLTKHQTQDPKIQLTTDVVDTTTHATILKPSKVPPWYSLPPIFTLQDAVAFFSPAILLMLYSIIMTLFNPIKIPKPPKREVSIIRESFTDETNDNSDDDGVDDDNNSNDENNKKDENTTQLQSTLPTSQTTSPTSHDHLIVNMIPNESNNTSPDQNTTTVNTSQPSPSLNRITLGLSNPTTIISKPPITLDLQLEQQPINYRRDKSTGLIKPQHQYTHFHQQQIEYISQPFTTRLKTIWNQHFASSADIKFYKFLWRSIVCITVASFIVLIPSPFKQTEYVHWPSLTTAILLSGDGVGAAFYGLMNRVIAQILGAFYAYIVILIAVKIDTDHDLITGYDGKIFVVAFLALLTLYFSWARTSRSKNVDYCASVIVSACVIGFGSLGTNTDQQVLHRLQYTLYGSVIVVLGSLLIFPTKGENGIHRLLTTIVQGLLTVLDFNSQLLSHTQLYQYTHGSFTTFGPTIFPIVNLSDDKLIEFELTEDEYQEMQQLSLLSNKGGKSVYDSLQRKMMLLERCDQKIYDQALLSTQSIMTHHNNNYHSRNYHHKPILNSSIHHVPSLDQIAVSKFPSILHNYNNNDHNPNIFRTHVQIFHPFDSRSQFFHICISVFSKGSMSLDSIGLKLLAYPNHPPPLPKNYASLNNAHISELFQQHKNYNTIRNTNYLNFLFMYHTHMKSKSADLRLVSLNLHKLLNLVERESVLSVISSVNRANIPILRSTFGTIFTLIRLIQRVHELLFCYQFILITLNEYYNSSGCDMNSSFKSIIQLNYEAYLKQQQQLQQQQLNKLHHDPLNEIDDDDDNHHNNHSDQIVSFRPSLTQTYSESISSSTTRLSPSSSNYKHFHDDLAGDNNDLTQLLISHSCDILHRKIPELSQVDLFIHLKTKTLQINKMLLSECLPLFLSFNNTMSLLFQSTLGTVDSLVKQTIIPTTLTFAISFDFSYPSYHTHNTLEFQRYRARKRQQLKLQREQLQSETDSLIQHYQLQQNQHDQEQQQSSSSSSSSNQQPSAPQPSHGSSHSIYVEDEEEFFNTPYAYGFRLTFLGFQIGPCCNRKATIPTKQPPSVQFNNTQPKSNININLKSNIDNTNQQVDVEMGSIKSTSTKTQPISLKSSIPTPITPTPTNTRQTQSNTNSMGFKGLPGLKPLQQLPPQNFPNPFYERSQRVHQQKQYLYQLIAHLRQIKLIFQEITYQRFYGGRDGFYLTYPTPLVNIEHAFLAVLEQCPLAFVEFISQLQRIEP